MLVAFGVEVCFYEFDGAPPVTKEMRRTRSTGIPAGYLQEVRHVRHCGRCADPLPGVLQPASCFLFEEFAQGDGPVVGVF